MSNLEDYNTKLEVIKAIPDDKIKIPNSIPVGIYNQEAEVLLKQLILNVLQPFK
jgi:hypothetical protein